MVSHILRARLRHVLWAALSHMHRLDFGLVLPTLGRMPLGPGFALAAWRGRLNAAMGKDWRSMALGSRHISRATLAGLRALHPQATESQLKHWCRMRFRTEAREEFEARLVATGRLNELICRFDPPEAGALCAHRERGLVLLTPHFDSFFAGVGFLARSGGCVNLMTSSITRDPRVNRAVQQHFERKYRGLEKFLNAGRTLDLEKGLRPFFDILMRKETLVILADAPAQTGGVSMQVNFLGMSRILAAGALRLARRTGSDLGSFICHHEGQGRYRIEMGPLGPAKDENLPARIYRFFGEAILKEPGKWWATDLLPAMPVAQDLDPGAEDV